MPGPELIFDQKGRLVYENATFLAKAFSAKIRIFLSKLPSMVRPEGNNNGHS